MSIGKTIVTALLLLTMASAAHGQTLETRVGWLDHCPSDTSAKKRAFPLLAVLLPYAINAGVDYASTALTKATSDQTSTSAARDDEYLIQIDATGELHASTNVACLVVIKGIFSADASAPQFEWATNKFSGLQEAYFQFEAKLINSVNDSGVYRLAPVNIKSSKPETSSVFSSARRDYNVSVTMTDFSAKAPFASVTFNMTIASPGENGTVPQSSLSAMLSEPISFPSSFTDVTTQQKKRGKSAARQIMAATILDASWQAVQQKPPVRPNEFSHPEVQQALRSYCMTIQTTNKQLTSEHKYFDERCLNEITTQRQALDLVINRALTSQVSTQWARDVCPAYQPPAGDRLGGCGLPTKLDPAGLFLTDLTLTETRHGAEWAKTFAKAVADNKDAIKSSARALLPSEKEKAQQSAQDAARQAHQGVLLADLAVEAAQQSLDELALANAPESERTQARIALLRARIERNDAYRKAGLAVPDPEVG